MNKSDIVKQESDFILYTSNDGDVNVEVVLKDETVWLTQKAMSGLFGVKVPAIIKHLANIYETGELRKESTISILETVQKEGDRKVRRKMEFYNLDAIISVGYRVNSYLATQFRIWATKTHMGLTNWKQALDGKILMKMQDWVQFLHSFLELSNYPILQDKNYISDFDKEIERITGEKYD